MQRVSPPPPAVSVSESHLAAVYFSFFFRGDCIAAVMGAPSLLHLCLKVTAEEGWQARQAPGGASHFEGRLGAWWIQGGRGKCAARSNKSFCQCYSMFWCVGWVIFFSIRKSVIEGDWEEQAEMGAFEPPSIVLALWESYLCLQHTHTGRLNSGARACWTRADLAALHLCVSADGEGNGM